MKQKVVELLSRHLKLSKKEVSDLIEQPKPQFGDYAFPCFSLAKKEHKNPAEIAKDIADKLSLKLPKEISKIEAVGGYVNFFVNKAAFANAVINTILKEKEKYGSDNLGNKKKILIEHTSINPNAPPHIGTARGALIGDSIVKLLNFQNYKTEVHYYINDVSKQVALLVLSCKGNEKFDKMLGIYVKAAKKFKQKKFEKEVFAALKKLEQHDKTTVKKFKRIVNTCVQGQRKILSQLDIHYDFFDYESDYLNKKLYNIIQNLKKSGKLFKDESGRLVLNQAANGLEKEMKKPLLVLTRSDGTGLYALRDLAYTIDKLKRTKQNIIVLGEEHKLYFKQLSAALKLLGFDAPKVLHYSHVLIQTKVGKRKMSKRRGELILLSDFINEAIKKAKAAIKKRKSKGDAKAIALAAVKYSILKTEQNKNVLFNWKEALNFEGNSGPYLQYAYARASSILRKLKKAKIGKADFEKIKNKKEIELIKQLSLFPTIIGDATLQLKPHLVANYVFRLSQIFSEFYSECPVIKAQPGLREARIALVKATKQVLSNSLFLLGIKALERM